MKSSSVEVSIEGRVLKLSNLDKVLYSEAGFTKGMVIDYYTRIAPFLLPHLRDRPLTLKRYPNGVSEEFFYEKNCPKHRPEWMQTAKIWSEGNGRFMYYCVVGDLASLVWVANLATLELHTSLSLGDNIERPRMLVFDLDPGPPATIVECSQVGLWLRDLFAEHGLQSFAKTSGSKGLQLYIPLNTPVDYGQTKVAAHGIAKRLAAEHPSQVLSLMRKDLRSGKVFIDWSQNDASKTTVNVYSLRARQRPTVSTPLSWEEVEAIWETRDPELAVHETQSVLERAERMGDLFEPLFQLQQTLPDSLLDGAPPARRQGGGSRRSGLRQKPSE